MPSLNPQSAPEISRYDIIVVGSGAAGLYCALSFPSNLQIAIVTKDIINTGSSNWAQGGIAAAIDPTDAPTLHFEDTIKAGAGLCEPEAVQFLVENGSEAIKSLVGLGVAFDRHGERLAMTLEAAHSRPRVLHSADTTGKAIIDTLAHQVLQRKNIQVLSQAFALSLWLNESTGNCQGISLLYEEEITWVRASAVVLATGGGGQVFSQTTNPNVSTGDGIALAWRGGALLRDLEFYQFHPTALTVPGAPRFLISEAVRGEGAYLVDANGERFAFNYHPKGELAPRDVVSRAIFDHLQKTQSDPYCVYLDLQPIETERIRHRFPNIIKVCEQWGMDVFKQPIPVSPAAHYWMGGIVTNLDSSTSISGLYAVGETASTGVHGANRLASNSLLECIVFAAQLSQIEIASHGDGANDKSVSVKIKSWEETQNLEQVNLIRENLSQLMWNSAGISRSQEVLETALVQVKSWRKQLTRLEIIEHLFNLKPRQTVKLSSKSQKQIRNLLETLNLVEIADLILQSAMFRTESRGGHYRSDYPQICDHWQVHTLIEKVEANSRQETHLRKSAEIASDLGSRKIVNSRSKI